jgi:hydroxypyruvate reductase
MKSEARTRPLKQLAREIFRTALAEVDVGRAFDRKLERRGCVLRFGTESVDLKGFDKIWVASFGKAAWSTLDALLEALGDEYRPSRGIVVSNVPPREVPEGFTAYQGGHPVPNPDSQNAAQNILSMMGEADERVLVFLLISGGGSALVETPLYPNLTLDDMQKLNKLLVGCGASIDEINAIRKHLSAIKGGRLAAAGAKAHKVTFLLSDVPEGRPATIASGPTLPDPTTLDTCYAVASKYKLLEKFPPTIRELFENKELEETPKEGAEAFRRSQSFVVLSNHDVLHAAHRAAGCFGFLAQCEMCCDDWPLAQAEDCLFAELERMRERNPDQPVCLVSGGEILVEVTGDGVGGRSQAFVLHATERVAGQEMAVLSAGTDGVDGNSPAAGAVADGETLGRAKGQGMDPKEFFQRSDSYHFFEALGDAIVTGPQQNNLRDLRLLLAR